MSRPAVVLQSGVKNGAEGTRGNDIACGNGHIPQATVAVITKQVVTTRGNGNEGDNITCSTRGIASHNTVVHIQGVRLVVDAAAVGGCRVTREGAVAHIQGARLVVDAAACAGGGIAAEGAVAHIQGAGVADATAAF